MADQEPVDALVRLRLVPLVGPGGQVRHHVVGHGEDPRIVRGPADQPEEARRVLGVVQLVHGGAAQPVERPRDGRHRPRRLPRLHPAHDKHPPQALGRDHVTQLREEPAALPQEGHRAVEVHEHAVVIPNVHRDLIRVLVVDDALRGFQFRSLRVRGLCKHGQLVLDGGARERVHRVDPAHAEVEVARPLVRRRRLLPHAPHELVRQIGHGRLDDAVLALIRRVAAALACRSLVPLHEVAQGLRPGRAGPLQHLLGAVAVAQARVGLLVLGVVPDVRRAHADVRRVVHHVEHVGAGLGVLREGEEAVHVADVTRADDERPRNRLH